MRELEAKSPLPVDRGYWSSHIGPVPCACTPKGPFPHTAPSWQHGASKLWGTGGGGVCRAGRWKRLLVKDGRRRGSWLTQGTLRIESQMARVGCGVQIVPWNSSVGNQTHSHLCRPNCGLLQRYRSLSLMGTVGDLDFESQG